MEITLENVFNGQESSMENQLLLVKYSLKTWNNYHNTYFRYKHYTIKKQHDILVFGRWNSFNNDHPIGWMCSFLLNTVRTFEFVLFKKMSATLLPYNKRALIGCTSRYRKILNIFIITFMRNIKYFLIGFFS